VKQEQDDLIFQLRALFPSMTLVGQTQHILNSIFVELPFSAEIPPGLPSVENVALEEVYGVAQVEDVVLETVGAKFAHEYCVTGAGVKVGILDTGVDYTHEAFGGNGTIEAYLNAYGADQNAAGNKNRDGYFPTSTVVEGADFLGESSTIFVDDDDPIDANGHGTAVASAVIAMAPDVQLVAVKACMTGPVASCPENALVRGIEFMLDPFRIGTLDEKVSVFRGYE
jgi:subtilisin family serine protease